MAPWELGSDAGIDVGGTGGRESDVVMLDASVSHAGGDVYVGGDEVGKAVLDEPGGDTGWEG